jgi:hypothetical protein
MSEVFLFRSNQTIGAAAAEHDSLYLTECFVDNGILSVLRDCNDHRCLLVGRTGSGKSALLAKLREEEEHSIPIEPDSLSLSYIANSTVIQFFSEAGVNLNLFYRLLWRHVFCVEILRERYGLTNENKQESFLGNIWNTITRNKKYEAALNYLREWGDTFWQETDYRVREVTSKLEKDLQGAVEETIPGLKLNFSAARKLTQEQKDEIVNRGQHIVNKVQIRELSAIIDFLDEVLLVDRKKRYYITIDKLDEDWIEDRLRFKLIRALIETSLEFTRIPNVKVIIAIRRDLLDRVYRFTRDPGFQEEKFRTSSFDLVWSREKLVEVLDSRIEFLVRRQYTKQIVTHKDILRPVATSKKGRLPAIEYLLDRTLLRPRDIIHFFNECITHADGKPIIENKALFEAEGVYSRERFRALVDEWYGVYPNLGLTAQILRKRNANFRVKDLPLIEVENFCLQAVTSENPTDAPDLEEMIMVAEGRLRPEDYRRNIILTLYKVGLLGLRPSDSMPISWSHFSSSSVSGAEIDDDTRVYIQPTFYRHFGIVDNKST